MTRDDRHLAAFLALRFQEKSTLTFAELVRDGIDNPHRALQRHDVIAYLGSLGLRVSKVPGAEKVRAEPIPPLQLDDGIPQPAAGDAEYFHFPPETRLVRKILEADLFPFLVGPTGSGKSTLLERMMRFVGGEGPVYRVAMNGETCVDDLFGTRGLREGRTVFLPGPVLMAIRERRPLILEELDAAPSEVLFCLHALLTREPVLVPHAEDELGEPLVIDPWSPAVPRFLVGATGNTLGRGDRSGTYRGVQILNGAFLDRWTPLSLDYPEASIERKILIRRTGVAAAAAERIVDVARLARAAAAGDGEVIFPFSLRKTLAWATAVAHMGLDEEEAFSLIVLESAGEEDRETLGELFQRVYGKSADRTRLHRRAV